MSALISLFSYLKISFSAEEEARWATSFEKLAQEEQAFLLSKLSDKTYFQKNLKKFSFYDSPAEILYFCLALLEKYNVLISPENPFFELFSAEELKQIVSLDLKDSAESFRLAEEKLLFLRKYLPKMWEIFKNNTKSFEYLKPLGLVDIYWQRLKEGLINRPKPNFKLWGLLESRESFKKFWWEVVVPTAEKSSIRYWVYVGDFPEDFVEYLEYLERSFPDLFQKFLEEVKKPIELLFNDTW
jgi:hypothetical protein